MATFKVVGIAGDRQTIMDAGKILSLEKAFDLAPPITGTAT
jgi:hypothetical protein